MTFTKHHVVCNGKTPMSFSFAHIVSVGGDLWRVDERTNERVNGMCLVVKMQCGTIWMCIRHEYVQRPKVSTRHVLVSGNIKLCFATYVFRTCLKVNVLCVFSFTLRFSPPSLSFPPSLFFYTPKILVYVRSHFLAPYIVCAFPISEEKCKENSQRRDIEFIESHCSFVVHTELKRNKVTREKKLYPICGLHPKWNCARFDDTRICAINLRR